MFLSGSPHSADSQDNMDISPGDSTPTSEASYSHSSTPNAQPQQIADGPVLLANARLAPHPSTSNNYTTSSSASAINTSSSSSSGNNHLHSSSTTSASSCKCVFDAFRFQFPKKTSQNAGSKYDVYQLRHISGLFDKMPKNIEFDTSFYESSRSH